MLIVVFDTTIIVIIITSPGSPIQCLLDDETFDRTSQYLIYSGGIHALSRLSRRDIIGGTELIPSHRSPPSSKSLVSIAITETSLRESLCILRSFLLLVLTSYFLETRPTEIYASKLRSYRHYSKPNQSKTAQEKNR